MRLLLFALLLSFFWTSSAQAQIKDQDLEGITVKSKKLSVRDILDSIVANAPRNYAEPMELAATYTASYTRGTDTAFYAQVPVYLKKGKEYTYGNLLWDSTDKGTMHDNIRSKAQWDRVFTINDRPYPAGTNVMAVMKSLDGIADTKRILYASDQDETDPHFYLLFRPKGKGSIPIIIRPFISDIDEDSLFSYTLLKIRRRGWVITAHESALLLNDPTKLKELIETSSFTRARALIDSAKAQPNLRRFGMYREWMPSDKGRYYIYRSGRSDNLLNFSMALFKKFPDPEGYLGTGEIEYDYVKDLPEKLVPFELGELLKDRKKY